ncbi:CHAT domain-containing protein [Rhodocollybia butyracea]|uniref:CHAT domain-containing protein n=1 Tax=Rhodocollybia butyracea TaxID=206335 RepID=A0A9P5PFY3_9AGAR|nr:CHAT domain-containing protein [Rhodocollybia butyracea]
MFKKDITSRYWPELSKAALPYVETDFSRWTWEGDESDDMIETGSTETINMDADLQEYQEREYAFDLDFYADVIPKVVEEHLTKQGLMITLLKKKLDSQHWPSLQREEAGRAPPYIRTEFNQWTWEGDESDDTIRASPDSYSLGGEDFFEAASELDQHGKIFYERFGRLGDTEDITEFVSCLRTVLELRPEPHPNRADSLGNLGVALYAQYEHRGDLESLKESIQCHREGLELRPTPHPNRSDSLNGFANALSQRFGQTGDPETLEESIQCYREALELRPAPHPKRSSSLINLGWTLNIRFNHMGDFKDLEESVHWNREALELCPAPHPNWSMLLNNLAVALSTRFEQQGKFENLEESIQCHREALWLRPSPHPTDLIHSQTADFENLEESIQYDREALELRPAPHPDRPDSLNNLAAALFTQFNRKGDLENLEESIQCHREALELVPAPHPSRAVSLNNLAAALSTRFDQKGDFENLEESIQCHKEALELRPAPHPYRPDVLSNLAIALSTRFEEKGGYEDLKESIQCHREALELVPAPYLYWSALLNNLANALFREFELKGDLMKLEESIQWHRQALKLRPAAHPYQHDSLNNLAAALCTRFEQKGDFENLEESIQYQREALQLRPAPHPRQSESLNSLGKTLHIQFEQKGDFENLEESIQCLKEALELRLAPHPNRPDSLNNLAISLFRQFAQKGDFEILEESIQCHREALELRPAPHPCWPLSLNNLAIALYTRFKRRGDFENLEEFIQYHRKALELFPAPHPDWSVSLNNLANALFTCFETTGDFEKLEESIASYLLPASPSDPAHIPSPSFIFTHLEAAMKAFCVAIDTLSSSSLAQFSSGLAWATNSHSSHPSALEAYEHTIALLPRLATLDLHLQACQDALRRSDGLAHNAASCTISAGSLEQAIEFLEEARGVFWSQLLHLCTPLDHLQSKAPELAKKLRGLSIALEQGSFRNVSLVVDSNQKQRMTMEQEATHFCHLNEEWDCTLEEVRNLDGFENLLLPKPFHELKRAAINRHIVILNASKYGCDGLILTEHGITHVPFPNITLENAILLGHLLQLALSLGGTYSHISDEIHLMLQPMLDEVALLPDTTHSYIPDEIHKALRSLSDQLKPKKAHFQHHLVPGTRPEIIQYILASLWFTIVHPVIETLGLQRSDSPPRIWWCPTGPFAFLPIHAAGIYDFSGNSQVETSDYMISSYTPTLSPLLAHASQLNDSFKMLAIVEPSGLDYTLEELTRIRKWVLPKHLIALRVPESPAATVEDVLSHISKASIAHFACHGTQNNEKPLESALQVLPGDDVQISKIMGLHLNASLAFLSACETATGDRKVPDETVHIAAAMLFAGFRSVVGTMWAIRDSDAPDVVDSVYRHLFKDGTTQIPDTTEAALALHLAVKKMRKETKCSFEQWVPFIHLGL